MDLSTFIAIALVPSETAGESILDVELDAFRVLFSFEELIQTINGRRLVLSSYINGADTVLTLEQIAGTYVCEGVNEFGPPQQAQVTIEIQG